MDAHPQTRPGRLALALALMACSPLANAQTLAYGDSVALGNGVIRTWVEVDAEAAPLRIGVTMTEGVLSRLPHHMRYHSLELPRIAADSLFLHILFDWMPHGHSPNGMYTVPHFDFHFYMISRQEREAIPGGFDTVPVSPAFMPEDYVPVPGEERYVIPQMGAHYVDSEAPEMNGQPFSKTLIYGFYRGKMLFIEPMITRAYLLSHPHDRLPIKQPEAYQRAGYYPTAYHIHHDAERQVYDVYLSDFVWRPGTTVSSGEAPASPSGLTLTPAFPNPFGDVVRITYDLPRSGRVLLEILDVMGRRVDVLVDEEQPSGAHTVVWRPGSHASGPYVVRLTAAGERVTAPMVRTR